MKKEKLTDLIYEYTILTRNLAIDKDNYEEVLCSYAIEAIMRLCHEASVKLNCENYEYLITYFLVILIYGFNAPEVDDFADGEIAYMNNHGVHFGWFDEVAEKPTKFDVNGLRKWVNDKLDHWDERSMFKYSPTIKLTRSDMDILLVCCNIFVRDGNLDIMAFLSPEVKTVLKGFGYQFEKGEII